MKAVEDEFQDVGVLEEAEILLEQCQQLKIGGLEKLPFDVRSTSKFLSALSELRNAILFARLGASVHLLRDQEFGRRRQGPYYTPDLLVSFKGFTILVEVFLSNHATPDVSTPLDRGLKENGLCFSVEYRLGPELSVPGFGYEEREMHKKRAKAVVDKVLEKLSNLTPGRAGTIRLGEHRFLYKPSKMEKGYAAGGVTAVHGIADEAHIKKLLEDLEGKAKKRAKLPAKWQQTPFVVVYESRERELGAIPFS